MIVVTGASGLLGASVILQVRRLGLAVAGLYHCHPLQIPGAAMCPADLIDAAATRELMRSLKPETIIHCAAATNIDWCESHPEETEKMNVRASALLAEIAFALHAHLIYISTDAVFDGRQGNYSETDQPAPLNVYGRSKLAGERAVWERLSSALIVRVNIYGWNAQEKLSLGEWFWRHLRQDERVPGFTDITFCPMLVNDLADVLLQMMDRRLSGLYHVSRVGENQQVRVRKTGGHELRTRPRKSSAHTGERSRSQGSPCPRHLPQHQQSLPGSGI